MAEEQGQEVQGEAKQETANVESTKFTQADVDRILQERLAREGVKREELDELRRFKNEHQKQVEQQQQQDLEKRAEYDKLKESWQSKENEYKTALSSKDQSINDMKISNALTSGIMQQGLYPEAADLIKSKAKITEDGKVVINGKNADGIETELSVEEGLKAFAQEKPYLVRAQNQGGAGTASVETAGNSSNRGTLTDAQELQNAMRSGDRSRIAEIRQKIQNKWSEKGISPTAV